MSLVACRYNGTHKMKQTRLLIHEDSCPDRFTRPLRVCPYNPIHKIAPEKYEHHKKVCEQRPQVDEEVEKELREYLKKQQQERSNLVNDTYNKIITTSSSNSNEDSEQDFTKNKPTRYGQKVTPAVAAPVGMRQSAKDKSKKTERKLKQKEMMNLIENSRLEESSYLEKESIIDFSQKQIGELDDIYDNETEFHKDLPAININEINVNEINHEFDKQSQNTLFTNLSGYINLNNSQLKRMIDQYCDRNDYDPNASDIFIDKKNRNNVPKRNQNDKDVESFIITNDSALDEEN